LARGRFTSSTPAKRRIVREYGQPVERFWRLAVATVGQVQWELIELI
jgi:hypothetical protein